MIFCWVCIIISALCGIAGAVFCAVGAESLVRKIAGAIASVVVFGLICYGIHWWLYDTEGGERTQKTFNSRTDGGLYRIVKVYDMEGEEIARYEGKFDIEENYEGGITKVKFDMEGKRHIIYSSTGTVIIDEVQRKEER